MSDDLPAQYQPTWGIAYIPDTQHGHIVGLWQTWVDDDGSKVLLEMECGWDRYPVEQVTGFMPLTAHQAAWMEDD